MGLDGVIFKYRIGGALDKTKESWQYVGGESHEVEENVDKLDYMALINLCETFGYDNPSQVWYRHPRIGGSLKDSLREVKMEFDSFGPFLELCLENESIEVYISHGEFKHPLLSHMRPAVACRERGIDEFGRRKGKELMVDDNVINDVGNAALPSELNVGERHGQDVGANINITDVGTTINNVGANISDDVLVDVDIVEEDGLDNDAEDGQDDDVGDFEYEVEAEGYIDEEG
ncbi:hypothetical protein Tsubulata_025976 [Turnera subulata]|uniref:PB1-like domain-containing protein n=1 Tax=Turnera subulata TaxID=218843 RepID=A0A9Q0JND3_9ROSI|nr:hypothetical protein Tsubulata_025976 [Turnera subulata]